MIEDPDDHVAARAVDVPAAPAHALGHDPVQGATAVAGDRRLDDLGKDAGKDAGLAIEGDQIDSMLEDADGSAGPELVCGRDVDDLLEQVFTGRADERDDHQRHCELCSSVLSQTGRQWAPLQMTGARLETPPPGLRQAVMSAVRHLAGRRWALTLPSATGALHGRATGHLDAAAGIAAGTVRISTVAVAAVAERAAAAVPGVRRAWARAAPAGRDSAAPLPAVGVVTLWDGAAADAAVLRVPSNAAASAVPGAVPGAAGRAVGDAPERATERERATGAAAGAGARVVVQLLVTAEYGARLAPLAQAARCAVVRQLRAVTSVPGIVVHVHIDDVVIP